MESYPRQRARTRAFRLGVPRALTPSPDGGRVAFLRSRGGADALSCLWVVDLADDEAPGGRERLVVDPAAMLAGDESLPPEELARRERLREVSSGITDMATDRAVTMAAFALSGTPYTVRLDSPGAVAAQLSAPGAVIDPRPDPTGTHVAYVCEGALYVVPTQPGGPPRALCRPVGSETWGLADFIAAEELDRFRGFWWLADGSGLLAERVDDAPVATWWIADPANPGAPPREHRYPAAGGANADTSLWLVRLDATRTEVTWDHDALPYLATVSVTAHGDPVISLLSRDQRRQVILSVDPVTGETRTLRERTDPQWIDLMPGVPTLAPGGRLVEIVADREADAYRLTVDDVALTPEDIQVGALVDAGEGTLLVSAGASAVEDSVAEVGYDGAVLELPLSGVASARRSGNTMVTSVTDLHRTRSEVTIWQDGTPVGRIANLAELPVITPAPVLLTVGERELNVAVLFPTGHVPHSRALPVIMSPYGGPHARRVMAAGQSFGTDQWLADQGYVVIVADGRGTPGRGPAWDRAVKHDLATAALEDQVAALMGVAQEYPRDLDLTRVGIRGWSFGGYLAALAVLRRPDVFHAAVAGAPVTDWALYDTGYTERYLGLPDDDPAAYERSSLIPLAAGLEQPLLIIHGLADDNVVVAHSLRLSDALLAAGRQHFVLPLSGVTHMTPQEVIAENLLLAELDFFAGALSTP